MSKPIYAKFLNENGYESERKRAAEVFDPEKEYEIIGGSIGNSNSDYVFKGIEGYWNTVMFNVRFEEVQHLMDHNYAKYLD